MRRVLVVTIIVLAALLRFVHRAGSIHGILEDQQKGEKFREVKPCVLFSVLAGDRSKDLKHRGFE